MHKKYTHKDGKSYGPYLYETKRVDGKVITSYLGPNAAQKRSLTLFILVSLLLILGTSFVTFKLFSASPATGMVALDVNLVYKEGEKLDGDLKFRLKEGELVPRDSSVVISYADQSKTFPLSELILDSTTQGSYYAESVSLSGQGEGYGLKGTKFYYPQIDFVLEVSRDSSESESSSSSEEASESTSGDSQEITESLPESSEETAQTSAETEPSSESESSESSSEESASESSDSGITGSVISEESYTVSGSVSRDADFEFDLAEGERAEIVSGSVMIDGEVVSANTLDLQQDGNGLVVSTDYFVSEEGFGEDFIGDYALVLEVPMEKLDLIAVPGTISVELIYNDVSLAILTKKVSIAQSEETPAETVLAINPITLVKDIPTTRIAPGEEARINLADYFSGAESYSITTSDIDASLDSTTLVLRPAEGFKGSRQVTVTAFNGESTLNSNTFLVLVSSGAVSITTVRSKIVVGEPVQWSKSVSLDAPEELAVELPTDASNIVVTDAQSGEVIETDNSARNSLISGNVVIELDLEKESSLTSWFKDMWDSVTSLTGLAIDEVPQETLDLTLPEASTEYIIEYTTPAPTATETSLTSTRKEITISAADDLHYTDVIAFTAISNEKRITNASRISIKWKLPESEFVSESVSAIKEVKDVPEEKVLEGSVESSQEATIDSSASPSITGNAVSVEVIEEALPLDQVTSEELSYQITNQKVSVPFDAYDLDEDGNIDYIEWVVPHLSDQTYEVLIAGAQHLDSESNSLADITSEVLDQDEVLAEEIPVGNHLYLDFTEPLSNTSILRLWASYNTKNGQSSVEIYNPYTVELINSGYLDTDAYTDFDLSALAAETTDALDIVVTDESAAGVALVVDQAVGNTTIPSDTTSPSVSFVSPTPSDSSTQSATSIPVNFTASDSGGQYAFLNFNRDLRLWLTMDRTNSTGGLVDQSGWGNNATLRNGALIVQEGPFNSSLRLNGTFGNKPYAMVANHPSLKLNTTGITVSAWINRSSTSCYYHASSTTDNATDTGCAIVTFTYPSGPQGWEFYSSSGNLLIVFRNGGTVANTATPGLSNGVWTHVAFTFNGSVIRHYINGINVKNTTSTPWADPATEVLGIGVRSPTLQPYLGNVFNGSIDEVMVFNRSLEPQELYGLYSSTSHRIYRNYTGLSEGTYNFTAYSMDASGNRNSVSRGVTIGAADASAPNVNLIAPSNGSAFSTATISFNATFSDGTALANATFYLWNSSQSIINTTIQNLNGTSGGVNLSVTLPYNGVFKWNYLARDSTANAAYNSTNYTVTYDSIAPSVQITAPTNTSYTSTVTSLIFTATDTNLQSCWYSTNNGATNTSTICNIGVDVSSSQGTNTWRVYANDSAGNRNSSSVTFFVDSTLPTVTYVSPTPSNNTYIAGRNLSINITSTDTNLANSTIYLFNSSRSLINSSFSATSPNYVRFINLADGIYYFNATARDTSGNLNSTLTRQVTLDSTAPTLTIYAPLNITYSSTSVPINATSSDVSTPSISFNIDAAFFDNIYEGATTATLGQGAHTVNFTSTDSAGNLNSTMVHLSVDSITPTISFVSPTPSNNTYTSITSLTVNVTGNESSRGTGLVTLDGTNYTLTCTGSTIYYCNYTFNTLSEGTHTYLARMNDSAGNTNSTSLRTITIDSLVPAVQFVGPSTNNNSRLTNRTVIINTSATDGLLANITTRIYNSTGLFNITTSATSPLHLVFTNLVDGTYTFNSTAIDSVGNTNTTETRTVYLDATAPGVSITSPSNSTWSFSTINIVVVLSENGTAQYTLNEGATNYSLSSTNNINFNATNTSIGDGQYTLRVYANDTFGNTNHTVTRTFVIDNSPPVLNITSPLNTTYTSNPILVEYTAVDAIGTILQMEYNPGDGYVSYTGPVNVTVSQGSHTFDFAGVDDSDNTNITSVTFFLDSINPTINYSTPTTANNSILNKGIVTVNVTSNDTNLVNITINFFNNSHSLINSAFSTNTSLYHIFGNLTDGIYYFNATATDVLNNQNSTATRRVILDSVSPTLNITAPLNITYNTTSIPINFTASDLVSTTTTYYNIDESQISTFYLGSTFETLSQGPHRINFTASDEGTNLNSTVVHFSIDSITPTISFVSPTPSNNTYTNATSLSVNITGNESTFNRGILTVDDVNYTMTCSGSSIYYCNYTLTGLSEGVHRYRASVNDSVGYSNSTEPRTITVDSQRPLITYDLGTENDGEVVGDGSISLVLNITESNVANVTFNLYNSSGLVNRSVSSVSDLDHTFSSVSDGVYTYFASVSDTSNNVNITSNRSIRVISSCLNQCTEGSSCTVSSSCMLYSGLCTGNVCDFTNLTLNNATIYTLYDSTTGRSLVLNITSNATNALRFILNSSVIFGGKNGSTLGSGSLGGNGGVLNITLRGLFNRTNAQLYSTGGYSTVSGSGGNGGVLQVMYHGLIGTTSAWTTSFSAGSSVSSSLGTAGSSTLIKDSACPIDTDLSNDGAVGIVDVARITTRYGNVTGDSTYEAARDINCDGELNVLDISKVGFEYGR